MRVTGVAAVNVGAMSMAVHMTGSAVNVIVGLPGHRSYSTRVMLRSAVDGLVSE
jgi:hypothetical protein